MHRFLRQIQQSFEPVPSAVEGDLGDLTGAIAVVDAAIAPLRPGRIKCQATFWFGQCDTPLAPGALVRLLRRQGNTWIVQPLL